MRGEKRFKQIETELEELESNLNLKLIDEEVCVKRMAELTLEMDQILYKDCRRELDMVEDEIKQLYRHNARLESDYLIYLASDKNIIKFVEDIVKINTRGIKRSKKYRTFILNLMKKLSKTL